MSNLVTLVGGRAGSAPHSVRPGIAQQQKQSVGEKLFNLSSGIVITPPLAASTPARPSHRIPNNLLNNANVSVIRENSERDIEVIDVTGPPGPQQIVFKSSNAVRLPENKPAQSTQAQIARGPLRARLAPKASVHKKRPLTVPITTETGRFLPGVTATKSKERTENVLKEALAVRRGKLLKAMPTTWTPLLKSLEGGQRRAQKMCRTKPL